MELAKYSIDQGFSNFFTHETPNLIILAHETLSQKCFNSSLSRYNRR